MEHKALHQPFELYVSDMEHWQERPLIYHFFEIVQILEGSGTRLVNNNTFTYKKGCIFLFTPLDCRGFETKTPTRFCSIRFSEVFLGQYRHAADRERIGHWLKQLEHLFYHHNRFREILIQQPGDCQMITTLIHNMIGEYEQKPSYHEQNLQHLVTLILNILVRNVHDHADTVTGEEATEPLINGMLLHIRQHISDPEKLRVDYLAQHFNLSVNYVGEYFRKFTGESLQQYITQYKIRLVQQRLAYSNLTVSQIAGELGFSDESHLSRQFRKHNGVSPLEYRKNARPA
ncbi:helix-turn-helix domain-containing protein [Chitinophaga nivalis]|uniref:Helix-turn-helix domain-containing protein n=1 Tax=Chitinophaga nivalis TaxID=2991709 RepID=A0ABT3II30_9BACT|nr:helix-turn-helix domain-containing protein [Chitinophaga nivalis]MCW3466710.1 helix-turn-helix domain-containing protein [Chitinophaga nivalis]MCW3483599.1 helix-turn-helix domain-containing protein [Chitinophaga nivalis]